MRRAKGFSVIELTMAMGMMLLVVAAVFSALNPSQGSFSVEPEVADLQQRMRVASDTLTKDLVVTGAGAFLGTQPGALNYFFAPVMPSRQGVLNDDPPGTFKTDTITLVYVPSTTAQTTLKTAMTNGSELVLEQEKDCFAGVNLCGFVKDMTILVYDGIGNYDLTTIADVNDNSATIVINRPPGMMNYGIGAQVIEAVSKTYYLKSDDAAKTYQLMMYDGTGGAGSDVPVVDNVVGLTFEYYGDPQPPILKKSVTDPIGPWTTYGPKPPALGVQNPGNGYPAGENCIFQVDTASGMQVARLPVLGDGSNTLVKLTQGELTDGPWCPDAASPNRWDADLVRIRKLAITLRVQSAVAALRGPASTLFRYAGTSTSASKLVPDQEIRFQVSPRNLNLGR